MTETLPTHKESNFTDVLAGLERYGSYERTEPMTSTDWNNTAKL